MTLRARIRGVWIAITASATFGSWFLARAVGWDPVKTSLVLLLPLLVGLMAVQVTLVRRLQRRLERAFANEDVAALKSLLGELIEYFRGQPRLRETLRITEAAILSIEERHAEARAILESIDQSVLGESQLPILLNNLAWCMAHLGEAERALELARAALARAEGGPDAQVSNILGTIGAAHVLAGQPADAVPVLQKALGKGGGQPLAQTIRAFYLGEALRALGREQEARGAYERAAREAPATRFARRAREQLGT